MMEHTDRISHRSPERRAIRLSEVISALSYALDLTEGQPMGHANRSCAIGMRLASEIGLSDRERSSLFYGLLLKDAGCSSNAARMCSLFGADDRWLKVDTKLIDWSRLPQAIRYLACHALPGGPFLARLGHMVKIGLKGSQEAKRLVEIRCERGADIVRMLDFPEETAEAIRALDEHWDGGGYPDGCRRQDIPLLARILSLAQTVEVFFSAHGLEAACDMARSRRGRWFDPDLVDALIAIRSDSAFWARLADAAPLAQTQGLEPHDRVRYADDAQLDRVAEAFARVVDAKSPWTFRHSEGVADIAVGMGRILGFSPQALRDLRRAALLHDIGKLGVSNLILDKPGRLSPDERAEMCRHTVHTHTILGHVASLEGIAHLASSHHERLDGTGYHRGLTARELSPAARVLPVADIFEALSADRPYRPALPLDRVLDLMRPDVGTGLCPRAFGALQSYLATRPATRVLSIAA